MEERVARPRPGAGALPELSGRPIRYYALDALRVIALLLGVVLHAALAYVPSADWALSDPGANRIAEGFSIVARSFQLPVFFVLAGFFGRLALRKHGVRAFARGRARRILLPFVVGWFLLRPPIAFLWSWADSGDHGPAGAWRAGRDAAGAFLESLGSPQAWFIGTHLWFLYYLSLLYAGFLVLRAGAAALIRRRPGVAAGADALVRRVVRSRGVVLLLSLPTTLLLLRMDRFGVDDGIASLVPKAPLLGLYGIQFALGWMLHRQPELIEDIARRWKPHLVAGAFLAIPVLLLPFARPTEPTELLVGLAQALYGLMMWAWLLGVVGFAAHALDRPSAPWRYLADASYWLYLTHLPLVVLIQILMADVDAHWTLELCGSVAVALPILLLAYHFLVRSTFVGEALSGRRYPLRWWPRRAPSPRVTRWRT